MMLAFAFGTLGLRRVFVSVLPENPAPIRMFGKLGFRVDNGPEGRRYADAPSELVMSVDAAPGIANLRIRVRGGANERARP
jgi:hypothetical protein